MSGSWNQCVREGLKVVSCLEQNFGLDVSDGLVCLWLYIPGHVIYFVKRGCCSQVLLIFLVDHVKTDVESCGLGMCRLPLLPRMLGSIVSGCWVLFYHLSFVELSTEWTLIISTAVVVIWSKISSFVWYPSPEFVLDPSCFSFPVFKPFWLG
jgi:hypothetical protein